MNRVEQAAAAGSPLSGQPWRIWGGRLIGTLILALFLGWASGAAMRLDGRLTGTAGFGRGLLHGILMPLAWPTLLVGHEQEIYSAHNSGRLYKLGYSLGVNLCGAAFFGWAYGRWRRWASPR